MMKDQTEPQAKPQTDARVVPLGEPTTLIPHDGTLDQTIVFSNQTQEVARISADGIMRFTVDANDENAAKFVECLEKIFSRRLTGVEVERKQL